MSTNRIVRIVVGLVLIGYGVYSGNAWFYLGVVPFITGIINCCLLKMKMGTSDPASGCCITPAQKESSNACCATPTPTQAVPKQAANFSFSAKKGKIEVLGIGCAKCITLEKIVREVVNHLDGDYEVVKVDNIMEIMKYNILSMPGFVIDGKLISTGKVLSTDEVRQHIKEAQANA